MANQQHLKQLKKGAAAWNTWRTTYPNVHPDLVRANLSGANLSGANLTHVNLSGANLSGAELSFANLAFANLSGADLSGADLLEARLIFAKLSGASLNRASLIFTKLTGANLSRTNLREASLHRADLSGADLSGADLSGAVMNGTSLGDQDLRKIKGLETVQHIGPSPLSINAIYLSQGDIPEAFVRGTGAPDSFLEYMKALASKPIEYYTCFISYSSQDDTFVKRLHADLQQQGVRCWFAPYDLRPGDVILVRIDEAIRLYDKLILILSRHSVGSRWVGMEVKAAQTKELDQDCQMLFPLRLDEMVMSTTTAWARSLREQRHIADFIGWKDHDTYQEAFTRLLRDLQPDTKPSHEP